MNIKRSGQIARRTGTQNERKVVGTTGLRAVNIPAWEKANSALSPYCVPNEYICAEIGRYLRLPVMSGAITSELGNQPKYWFTTLDLGAEVPLQPVNPEECVERLRDLCAAVLLFDILIGNGDRTPDNLYLDRNFDPPELRVFDHESALLGDTADQAEGRLTGSLTSNLGIPNHCLASLISSEELLNSPWIKRIEQLPDYLIEETCQAAAQYGMKDVERDATVAFLKQRRSNLRNLIKTHRAELGKRSITS